MIIDWGEGERRLTDSISVLVGAANGAYPSGNTLLVRGAGESVLIDPSVTVVERGGAPVNVDAVINSHSHEDHMAGNGLFVDAPLHIHDADLIGAQSIDGLMEVYGLTGAPRASFEQTVIEEFHYTPRPDAQGFTDGHIFDLGGGVNVEAVHLPGHTRGHSGFRMDDVFFLSDIDLTGFGPYYGDRTSSLTDFRRSLDKLADIPANTWVTYHHRGVYTDREHFLKDLATFTGKIDARSERLLDLLSKRPLTLTELASLGVLYDPEKAPPWAEAAETYTISQHLEELLSQGLAVLDDDGKHHLN